MLRCFVDERKEMERDEDGWGEERKMDEEERKGWMRRREKDG